MTTLFVLYDAQCPFCLHCRQWLAAQATLLELEFIPFQAPELVEQFDGIESFRKNDEMLVVGDDGAVYQGPGAFIMLLFALRDYHEWAFRLRAPALMPLAAQYLGLISLGSKNILKWLDRLSDSELSEVLRSRAAPVCADALTH